MGYAGVKFDIAGVKITFSSKAGEIILMEKGTPIILDEAIAAKILAETDITFTANRKDGMYKATAGGCDLTYDYVK